MRMTLLPSSLNLTNLSIKRDTLKSLKEGCKKYLYKEQNNLKGARSRTLRWALAKDQRRR